MSTTALQTHPHDATRFHDLVDNPRSRLQRTSRPSADSRVNWYAACQSFDCRASRLGPHRGGGPALIVFFRGAYRAADSGGDDAEALGDLEYHLGSARPALDSLGVDVQERYGENIDHQLDGARRHFTPAADSGRAAYLFLAPGVAVHVHYGLLMDIDLAPEVRSRFNLTPAGAASTARVSARVDIAHVFAARRADLVHELERLRSALRPDAVIWVSWPKKAAKVSTDITEDVIREVALPLGLVDIKVCAVTDVWSGLKLVVRKELRRPP